MSSFKEELEKNGYCIFKKIFDDNVCSMALDELHIELDLAYERFENELGIIISRTYVTGDLNALGIAHLSMAWFIRKQLKPIIANLFKNTNLLCSMEGYINYRREFQYRQSLHHLNEKDPIDRKRLKCIVMLTECSPVNGGVMIQNSHQSSLEYVNLNRGDVLVFNPNRVLYKYVVPEVIKEEWVENNGLKHSLKTVSNELCMLPITFQDSSQVDLSTINQRLACALNKRSTLSDILQAKRRPLPNTTIRQYEQRYIIPTSYVEKHQLASDCSMSQFRYENEGNIAWYLLDSDITSLIRGEDYKEK
jgi:signal peptidase I